MPDDPRAPTRAAYPHFSSIATRWMDNDVYGHINNVVYYAYFDTVINRYLIEEGGLDIAGGDAIGLCVESHCAYLRPISFPAVVDAGLLVAHLGRTSARYEIGIFAQGSDEPSAHGWFVHVFVDRATRRPAPLPASIRAALERLASVTSRTGP
jgi:acyl-CoA thioester hydrolase